MTCSDPYVAMRNELERLIAENGVGDFLLAMVSALDRQRCSEAHMLIQKALLEGRYR